MRRNDWQERFAEYVRQRREMPFAWGSNDCCTFAAGCVEAFTGSNPMARAPSYECELGAARLIVEAGGLGALTCEYLGVPVGPAFAGLGDVVLLENEGRELLGICNGVTALAPAENGTAVLPMNAARAAWKI